ncbi:MAG TPA: 4-(cytidine 5'-diphospho)-2-C-methyl-D-erythritol kinase [Kiloniellaceae bacterium]|nr:4-(cytidine 5'-diphospho)-2-C-methyl-D-erythritol kinase [Kiloniellaceae bacterium]
MLSVKARAKVNLTLRVTGKRADGYHFLQSLVCFPDVGDLLEIEAAATLTLAQAGPFAEALGPVEDNLVLRAAAALQQQAEVEKGAAIRLAKNLPVAAGVGGGSADAAAVLKGLMALWEIEETAVDLPALALSLGADVPVCLAGQPTLVAGIGEDLTPLAPLPALGILLVNPRQALATAAVFKAHWDDFSAPEDWSDLPDDGAAFVARLAASANDLEAAACRVLPVVDDVLDRLRVLPGCRLARMSGSGATCFGLFTTLEEAKAAAADLGATAPDWWHAAAPLAEALP